MDSLDRPLLQLQPWALFVTSIAMGTIIFEYVAQVLLLHDGPDYHIMDHRPPSHRPHHTASLGNSGAFHRSLRAGYMCIWLECGS